MRPARPPHCAGHAARLRIAFVVLSLAALAWQFLVAAAGDRWLVAAAMPPCVSRWVTSWIVWAVIALCFIYLVRSDVPYRPAADEADRPWQFSLRTLLLLPLWLWLLLLACFPKLMTGDFCNVRIDVLSVHASGQAYSSYTRRSSSGTGVRGRLLPDSGGGYSASGSLPMTWASPKVTQWGFSLNPDRIPMAPRAMHDRLLVEQGRTYRVVPGKPLCVCDFKGKDGTRNCFYIEVLPRKRLGF